MKSYGLSSGARKHSQQGSTWINKVSSEFVLRLDNGPFIATRFLSLPAQADAHTEDEGSCELSEQTPLARSVMLCAIGCSTRIVQI